MRVLLTGAAGFIGFFLARELAKDKEISKLYLVDNFIRGERDIHYMDLISLDDVDEIELDLSDSRSYYKLPDDIDIVIHFAALNGTQNFYERPFEVIKHSSLPTYFLLEKYVVNGNVNKFVYASSSEAYSATVESLGWKIPTSEDVPLCISEVDNPRWSYAVSKIWGEVSTVLTCKQFNVSYLVIRYHNVYGPRMGYEHMIPDFLRRLKEGKAELYGYDNTRSFLYISDAIEATLDLIKNIDNEIVNVGSDDEVKILDVAKMILDILNISCDIRLYPAPRGSVSRRCPDLRKLKELINFKPKVSLRDGLKRTIDYYFYNDLRVE